MAPDIDPNPFVQDLIDGKLTYWTDVVMVLTFYAEEFLNDGEDEKAEAIAEVIRFLRKRVPE